ncbi:MULTISPECIES: signal peptidase I [Staphylococcus]|uniref:Signal peptidase I n=1 Tax=Staphylococcus schleiferi TaxID=1295 RepID=A0A7Z7QR98_STASC|nr:MULTISPECIES: signal peptidase I [Staphylococcus]EPD53026.1 signal peptidase I [Staphylococcus sp. HGB0015]MBF1992000.1 signal peptidase I [Staphylococcus schleiferi]MBF2037710.1 signal peptidase I [Staphylococcus schleiferi]MBF2099662.1 signal peptidase I [Staphylococcus schleiferi]MBF2101631.1 signal peptidase I [Staphylococcus schleiferi]
MKFLIRTVFAGLLAWGILALLILFVAIPYQVKTPAMQPTLHPNDRLIVNKIATRFNDIKHADIVVYKNKNQYHIGRVIGKPGQSVVYHNGQLQLDNTPVAEPYLRHHYQASWSLRSLPHAESDIIPPNAYLILNDDRGQQNDSRKIGLINKSDIEGKVFMRYYPFDNITINLRQEV